jgi:hypothetical protein
VKPTVEEIGSLLALKRHERPEEGYFDDFLREFHQRRRAEELTKRGPAGWWKQASDWISNLGASKWAYGGGLAYAAVAAFFLLAPKGPEVQQAPTPTQVAHEVKTLEPAVEQLDALDLRPSSQGSTGEQEF